MTFFARPSTPSPCPSPTRGEGTPDRNVWIDSKQSAPNKSSTRNIFFSICSFLLLFSPASSHAAQVTTVFDGDTIQLSDGKTVRYIGINTPEYGQPFAEEAKQYNEQLVLGKEVRVVPARRRPDAYKRVLAYVYVGNVLVNARLIVAGLAHVFVLDRFDQYEDWLRLQHDAQTRRKGMWRTGGVPGPLKITTVRADAKGNDWTNPNDEYVRVCNVSSQPVELSGFAIQDESNHRYVFPTGVLQPGYTALVLSGQGDMTVRHGQYRFHWDAGAVWNNTGDTAFLFDPNGIQIDTLSVQPIRSRRHSEQRSKRLTPPRQAR